MSSRKAQPMAPSYTRFVLQSHVSAGSKLTNSPTTRRNVTHPACNPIDG